VATYSIRDLEQLSGIKAHTLRIWEQRYNFIKPKRTDTNIRYYDEQDLKLVLNISLLKDHGHKISKISQMCFEDMQKTVIRLTEEKHSFPEQFHALTLAMIDYDEEQFDKVISANIMQYGFEKTMMYLVYPFFSKIGIMWQTGSICPSQEHFISNLLVQKIHSAIDSIEIRENPGRKKFLLFLPEGEHHELSLLFAWYMLKVRNNKVFYFGEHIDPKYVKKAYLKQKPDFIFTVLTTCREAIDTQCYVEDLSSEFAESIVILTGRQVVENHLILPENVLVMHQFRDLIEFCKTF
jgi:MerR family transcriptional regulator, light-induced transcriptional regulator